MGSFLFWLILILILVMALRFFIPLLFILIPIGLIYAILSTVFRRRTTPSNETTEESSYNGDPNVIDVDYKVVDEHDSDEGGMHS